MQIPRGIDPVCLRWSDASSGTVQGEWSNMGISGTLLDDGSGEIKKFRMRCSTNHLAAFGVAVDRDDSVSCCGHNVGMLL